MPVLPAAMAAIVAIAALSNIASPAVARAITHDDLGLDTPVTPLQDAMLVRSETLAPFSRFCIEDDTTIVEGGVTHSGKEKNCAAVRTDGVVGTSERVTVSFEEGHLNGIVVTVHRFPDRPVAVANVTGPAVQRVDESLRPQLGPDIAPLLWPLRPVNVGRFAQSDRVVIRTRLAFLPLVAQAVTAMDCTVKGRSSLQARAVLVFSCNTSGELRGQVLIGGRPAYGPVQVTALIAVDEATGAERRAVEVTISRLSTSADRSGTQEVVQTNTIRRSFD